MYSNPPTVCNLYIVLVTQRSQQSSYIDNIKTLSENNLFVRDVYKGRKTSPFMCYFAASAIECYIFH